MTPFCTSDYQLGFEKGASTMLFSARNDTVYINKKSTQYFKMLPIFGSSK